ncbi:DUF2236 domain-containing protein [Skermania sp. ID1734]|nr:DUF2236 domain-containing protein [Skermania sp. ID1734]
MLEVVGISDPGKNYSPSADYGFFGPGSVTWKVWSYPSSALMGFQRSVTIEQLDPNLNAAVEHSGGVRYRPRTRYERTMRYFALVAFGDTATATKAADVLVKVHSKAIGTDPVTGGTYDANSPESQLWIHVTAWHSILYCYEKFGPGKLTEDEERQYWAECARAAELQTIDPADVPRSRDEVRAYFESWRPRIAASELAQSMTDFILHTEVAFPEDLPAWSRPLQIPLARLLAKGTISTYPRHFRKLFGISQSGAEDLMVQWFLRVAFGVIGSNKALYAAVADFLVPTTAPIAMPAVLGIPAQSPATMTPREAQRRYGYDIPAEAHKALRAKQEARVFGAGQAPSDEGLIESQGLIGAMQGKQVSA